MRWILVDGRGDQVQLWHQTSEVRSQKTEVRLFSRMLKNPHWLEAEGAEAAAPCCRGVLSAQSAQGCRLKGAHRVSSSTSFPLQPSALRLQPRTSCSEAC